MSSKIGKKFVLKTDMLGNPRGTAGYAFAEYRDFNWRDETGIQIIFPNGEYDGFSIEEQGLFLTEVYENKPNPKYTNYVFENVIQVSRDFDKGYWKFE